jgi:hypothetical protein
LKTLTATLGKIFVLPVLAVIAYFLAHFVWKFQYIGIGAIALFPCVVFLICILFARPQSGVMLILVYSFVINGLGRYFSAPFSVMVDGLLLTALIAAIFHSGKEDYARFKSPLFGLLLVYTFFTFMELFNPEALGFGPWFFAVRSVSLYIIFLISITILFFKKQKLMDLFLIIWCIGGIVSGLYGVKQDMIGLDSAETDWLMNFGAETHLLFGELRIFSFYSDAGQFGAFMAFTSLVGFILSVRAETYNLKLLYLITGFVCAYGMLISGTRGALFVYVGAFVYLILDKNFKTLSIGLFVVGTLFCILKFTYIGAGNYDIQRLRSAVKPNDDPSYLVRLENQKKIKAYLSSRPLGGGIGSSGYWGKRFRPGSFLAETPTDSWYVRLWAETGVVGLWLYIIIYVLIVLKAFIIIWNIEEIYLKQKLAAMLSGCVGILVASYGNQLIGQFPTIVYFSMSLAFIYQGYFWNRENILRIKNQETSSKTLA